MGNRLEPPLARPGRRRRRLAAGSLADQAVAVITIIAHGLFAGLGVAGLVASGNGLANLAELIRAVRAGVTRGSAR
jgi:hypothetical protein